MCGCVCVVQQWGTSLPSCWSQHRVHKDSTKSRGQRLKEGRGCLGLSGNHRGACGLPWAGNIWRLHLVFGGRGPGLTFGLHGVRTVLIQRVNGPSQHRWEQSTVRRWQYRLAKPESRGGVRWEDGPGWGGEERGSLLLTPASSVQLPSLESLLLQTDAKLHFSLFPGSVMCLPATRH